MTERVLPTLRPIWNLLQKEKYPKAARLWNTASGPDGITYKHLKLIDPSADVLTIIYNLCIKFKAVPSSWKITTTILIYNKSDKQDPENWRPIALGNTIYKLFDSCLSKHVYKWVEDNKILSFNQKGFLPHDGVFENNYVLGSNMQTYKIKKKDLFFTSLDISSAFVSLPHWAIIAVLESVNIGE